MKKDKILVFGRGKYCKVKFENIKNRYEVIGFLDNSVVGEAFDKEYGYPVYNPELVCEHEDCYVVCMSAFYVEMWKQLIKLGVDCRRIIFGVNLKPFYSMADEICFGDGQELIATKDCIIYKINDSQTYTFKSDEEFKAIIRDIVYKKNDDVRAICQMSVKPISKVSGIERGKAVDRYYIEHFLNCNSSYIKDTVMEIASNDYIKKFGGDKVKKELILHVAGWGKNTFKGNFETGEGIKENMADCLICTQTLQYIYDLKAAIRNIYKLLKPKGTALITVPGIKSLFIYDEQNWGERWSFTKESMRQLCLEVCEEKDFIVESYGNVKIAAAYLYGVCCEDLKKEDFEYNDAQFPFLITVKLQKNL